MFPRCPGLAVSLCLAVMVGSASGRTAEKTQQVPLPAGPEVAAELFEGYGCVECHTIGVSAPRRGFGPDLGRTDLRLSLFDGAGRLWNHSPGMVQRMLDVRFPFPRLTGHDLLNLVAFFTAYQFYLTRVGRAGISDRGEILFRAKGCHACHALEPGRPSSGPSLRRYGNSQSVLDLAQAMWNHGPEMQKMLEKEMLPRPYFREREMADILSFLLTRSVPSGRRSAYIVPGDPSRGAKVFQEHRCVQCHAVRGVGGKGRSLPGESPPPDLGQNNVIAVRDYTDIAALMWNHAVPMWSRMRRQNIKSDPFHATDLADLVAYLYFLNFVDEPGDPRQGQAIFEQRGCVHCHPPYNPSDPTFAKTFEKEEAKISENSWDVLASMWRHVPDMRALAEKLGRDWAKVKDGEMRHLITYVAKLRAKGEYYVPIEGALTQEKIEALRKQKP